MVYIIGSGLSAMGAAAALVRRGCRPTILDPGLPPDPAALQLKARLASCEPEDWNPEDLLSFRRMGLVAANGIPRKLFFGSDFVFRDIALAPGLEISNASIHRSFAAGGFSNIWGAVIQPFRDEEFSHWPVSLAEMQPCYDAVRALVGSAPEPLHPSSQAQGFYSDLWANRDALEKSGIRFDYPQIALKPAVTHDMNTCRYCGMCLHGCPYECTYTASHTLDKLIRENGVRYITGILVDRIATENGRLRIESRSIHEGSPRLFHGKRILVAAGFLESSRIILVSLGLRDIEFEVRHSDIFTLPVLRYSRPGNFLKEKMHTLCQVVIQIEDRSVCEYPVHLQVYGHNDLYRDLILQRLGKMAHPISSLLPSLEGRLLVIFGYLHSSVSSKVTVTLTGDRNPRLRVEGRPNHLAAQISRAVVQKLMRNRKYLHALPIGFALHLDQPGGGYHSGGTFPMRTNPGEFETDRVGSLATLRGVHIVDTSIFPRVPSSPTAFTAMANAYRIASEIELPNAE